MTMVATLPKDNRLALRAALALAALALAAAGGGPGSVLLAGTMPAAPKHPPWRRPGEAGGARWVGFRCLRVAQDGNGSTLRMRDALIEARGHEGFRARHGPSSPSATGWLHARAARSLL